MKVWERRLMKDFQVAPIAGEEELDTLLHDPPPENEDMLSKFRRVAKLAVLSSTSQKWGQVINSVCQASQIGRCNNRESFKNQQNLQRAMQEAKKLVQHSPILGSPRGCTPSPIHLPETTGTSIQELLNEITEETKHLDVNDPQNRKPPKNGGSGGMFLAVQSANNTNKSGKSPVSTLTTTKPAPTATKDVKPSEKPKQPEPQKQQKPAESAKPATKKESETKKDSLAECKGVSDQPDPSPLKPARRPGGESPPKVFKRKAPAPQSQDEKPSTSDSRAITPEPSKPADKTPPVPAQRQDARQSKGPDKDDCKPSAPPAVIPKLELTSPVNSTNMGMTSSSSTEQLIPESSPEALRPIRRIEDVNTIKRQPKAGWL